MTSKDEGQARDTRFRKGQSGNPKGRPKRSSGPGPGSVFDIIVDRTLTIRRGGKPLDVSMEEALQHQTYRKAIEGNGAARRDVLKMIEKREAYRRRQAPEVPQKPFSYKVEPTDPETANPAMLVLGIATVDESKLEFSGHQPPVILEVWAVQAALSRRRGGSKLEARDIREIERCTRNSDTLRWPRGTRS